jgi:hypothetical protein
MRVSPTPEQLEYLASLGVNTVTASATTTKRSVGRENDQPRIRRRPATVQARAPVGWLAGFCSGAVGLFLGGFFGLVTHGLVWGTCIGLCTAIGWSILGFVWSFGWKNDSARIGIGVAIVLAALALVVCFGGMLVAVMLSGTDAARAWIRGTLLVIWASGLVPGLVRAVSRLIQARRE